MSGSRRSVSFDRLKDYLMGFGGLSFSFLHPGGLLLFTDRLTFFLWDSDSAGEILLAETSDGVPFLPLPPLPFFSPDLSSSDRGTLLTNIVREIAGEWESASFPFLENCPLGLLPAGPFRIERSDREFLLSPPSLLSPEGSGFRALRWEKNRFSRDHPNARIRPFESSDRRLISDFGSRFSKWRGNGIDGDLEMWMAEDMGRAFGRAMDLWEEGGLEGWILEEKGALLGLEWVGYLPAARTLICFLEAREEGVSNVGSVMMRKILEKSGSRVDWVNIQGGFGLKGVERSKRMRPHDLVLPLFRVVPERDLSALPIENVGEDMGGFGKVR